MNPERQKIDSIQEKLKRLRQQEGRLGQQLKEAKGEYHTAILDFLGTNAEQPLADYAESILKFAQKENVDPEWFFKVLNSAAYLLINSSSWNQIPEDPKFYPEEIRPFFTDHHFKAGLSKMYSATWYAGYVDDRSGIPEGGKLFAKGRDLMLQYEAMLGQDVDNPKRLSSVYKWLFANTQLLTQLHELPFEERKKWLKE